MLASVLDGNEAARLNRDLVRTDRIGYLRRCELRRRGPRPRHVSPQRHAGAGQDGRDVEQALRGEVQKLVKDGVTDEELERVKAQVVAAHVYERDSMFSQARQIGALTMADLRTS